MKNKIFFIVVTMILMVVLIININDTYSYYIDTNNLSLVSSKIGKFGSVSKSDLKKDSGNQLQDTAVFGLYRFYGNYSTIKNNYICFGTNNKNTCTSDPKTYMYRIIGITDNSKTNSDLGIPENSLKIIKATSYGKYPWNEYDLYVTWDKASLNTSLLNQTFYNAISETNNGINWKKNIILSNHYWWIGDNSNKNETTETTSPIETTKSKTANPIGLMYKSDFINAGSQDTNNWLFIKNGWTSITDTQEWTMTRYNDTRPWFIFYSGLPHSCDVNLCNMQNNFVIRPCFYLNPEISLTGTGASDDPYLIS